MPCSRLAQLFRACLSHDAWACRVGPDGSVGAPGKPADAFCFAPDGDDTYDFLTGLGLAHAVDGGATELRLHYDPAMPPFVCSVAEAGYFRTFLQISLIENLLARIHAGAELPIEAPLSRLREYDSFYTLCAGGHGPAHAPLLMALAPDPEGGRKLAAAFTAEDALQLFVVAGDAPATHEAVSMRLSGRELFEQLAANDLDGVVFNPAGPGAPLALSADFAAAVLAANE
jgi:hypothetical protein